MNYENMEKAYQGMIRNIENNSILRKAKEIWGNSSSEEKVFWIITFNTFLSTRSSKLSEELRRERNINEINLNFSYKEKINTKFKNFYMMMKLGLEELSKNTNDITKEDEDAWESGWSQFNNREKREKRVFLEFFLFYLGYEKMKGIYNKKRIKAKFSADNCSFYFDKKYPNLIFSTFDMNSIQSFPSENNDEKNYFKIIFGFDYDEEIRNAFKIKTFAKNYFDYLGYKDGMPMAIPLPENEMTLSEKNTFYRMCLNIQKTKVSSIGMGYKTPIVKTKNLFFTSPNTIQLYINNLFNAISLSEFVEPISNIENTNRYCSTISKKYKSKNLVLSIKESFENILVDYESSIKIDVEEDEWNRNIRKSNNVGDIDLLIKLPKEKIIFSIESKWLKPNFSVEKELNKGSNRKRNISKWKKRTEIIFEAFKKDYPGWTWVNLFISSKPHGQYKIKHGNIMSLGQLKKWENKPKLQGMELSKINKIQL